MERLVELTKVLHANGRLQQLRLCQQNLKNHKTFFKMH